VPAELLLVEVARVDVAQSSRTYLKIRSRDWFVPNLGMQAEFEVPDRHTAALRDDEGFTILVEQSDRSIISVGLALYFRVADFEATDRRLSEAGVLYRTMQAGSDTDHHASRARPAS
jgi:hypothetical protein